MGGDNVLVLMRIESDRLLLVPQTVTAARALLVGDDPGIPLGRGYPHANTLDGLQITLQHATSDVDLTAWFVTLATTGEVIGDIGTKGWVDVAGAVEIGYGLAAPYRGRGYGREMVMAAVLGLAAHPDVRRVTAEVRPDNVASRHALERAGLRLDHEAGGYLYYALDVT